MHLKESYECFDVSVDAGVAHIQLNRPKKANSLTRSFWEEFPDVLLELHRAGSVRACVLSAVGDVFCGGLDLSMIANAPEFFASNPVDREAMTCKLFQMQDAITTLEKVRFPVIAAVNGPCVGGGFDLIAACDLILASQAARFRIEETNIGMMADLGILQRLPKLIAPVVVSHMALTGRTMKADEAHRLGLVAEVHFDENALLDAAMATAKLIAEKSPVVIASIKRSLNYSRDHSVSDSLEHVANLQAAMLSGKDIARTMQAAMDKSLPQHENLKTLTKEF